VLIIETGTTLPEVILLVTSTELLPLDDLLGSLRSSTAMLFVEESSCLEEVPREILGAEL
jgi:hypothetical protein